MNKVSIKYKLRHIYVLSLILMLLTFSLVASLKNDVSKEASEDSNLKMKKSVCPPFYLKDENGNVIDPVNKINVKVPYSPKQTCGASGCHAYNKITQGYHFMQGKGEKLTEEQQARLAWALTPGNYGGSWCSPAPLYRYLSPKKNNSEKTMDMTSFSFIKDGCGNCHPGGGSAEYDRKGKRYDLHMSDPEAGLVSGGRNSLDGDYYKANWDKTGVLEADCLICHLPGYDMSKRNKQLSSLNFRWAPGAGAGLANVKGSVVNGDKPAVSYDLSRFNEDGTISPNMVTEPRNEACLFCHDQPGWKKRGANYRARTDVHLRAGLKCTDCHHSGSKASDPRIKNRERHDFGKGDDPGGLVRNDLDNTVLGCKRCHNTGKQGAPIARHTWLPPWHLSRISCQTCHIPERLVKPVEFQAGDVFNTDTKIPGKGKRLWTFYGPDMEYRNHYGYLSMMGYDDKPTEPFKPIYIKYKGKIYPANRVHSAWPGIEIKGGEALMQPKMSDIVKMWESHGRDKTKYPLLEKIKDDNEDGIEEVNRPEEIDALIASVSELLKDIQYPMEGKRVVWVMNDRVYYSGKEYRKVTKHKWEASPYANVHKYNHDILPANAALGAKGCSDCHSKDSRLFFGRVLEYPFDTDGNPVWASQASILDYNGKARSYSGYVGFVAAFFKWLTIAVLFLLIAHIILDTITRFREKRAEKSLPSPDVWIERFDIHFRTQHFLLMVSVLMLFLSGIFMFGLRYPGALWAANLSGAIGGADFWRLIHRIGGTVLIITVLYHLVYSLLHENGRQDFREIIPKKNDFVHLMQNIKRFLGISKNKPDFGRFTYFEKFDYWAVFWGSVIMIGTGLAMWFHSLVVTVFPSMPVSAFDAFKEAHAHEAMLAFLAIVIWHVYNVHLRIGRFPGTMFWMHGKIRKSELVKEHPKDPTLNDKMGINKGRR